MKKKIIALSSIAICVLLIVIGITSAYFTSQDSVINVINTGSVNAVPKEDLEDLVDNKIVWVKNEGKNDCLVRVSITPRWVDSQGNPWAGDVNKITLNFSNLTAPPTSSDSSWEANKWIQGNDKYYYYTSILPVYEKKGEDEVGLTTKLLSSVSVKFENDIIPEEYKDKTFKIDVKVEAVQTTQNAYATVWDMDLAGPNIISLLSSITPK